MELSLNGNERGKPKYSEEKVTHCRFVLKKSHVYWLGSNPGLPQCISYREVTFRGNIWGDFCWWFTSVPADEIMTWNARLALLKEGYVDWWNRSKCCRKRKGAEVCASREYFFYATAVGWLHEMQCGRRSFLCGWMLSLETPPCWVVWMLPD